MCLQILKTFQITSNQGISISKLSVDYDIDLDEVVLENENKKPITDKELAAIKKAEGKTGVFGGSVWSKKEKFTYEDYVKRTHSLFFS